MFSAVRFVRGKPFFGAALMPAGGLTNQRVCAILIKSCGNFAGNGGMESALHGEKMYLPVEKLPEVRPVR